MTFFVLQNICKLLDFSGNYYPFGMMMPGRSFSNSTGYRYGFNGMEMDDEVKGTGNHVDFGARVYDSRLGKWLSLDPLQAEYPDLSPYNFVANSPIIFIDPNGKEIVIHRSNGSVFTYIPGMEVPRGDDFAAAVVKALNAIHSVPEGNVVISKLDDTNTQVNIKETNAYLSTSFSLGKNGERDEAFVSKANNGDYNAAQNILDNTMETQVKAFNGDWDRVWNDADNVEMNFTLAIGHELFHAFQFETNDFLGAYLEMVGDNPLTEVWAVAFENYLRATLFEGTDFEKTRASYSWKEIDEFVEEPDWWDYIIGFDAVESKEFKEGGALFEKWKEEYPSKAKAKTEEIKDN